METIVAEIERGVAALRLAPEAMRLLGQDEGEEVCCSALNCFVSTSDRRWWWEALRHPGVAVKFVAGDAWKHLPVVAPNADELIWLIAEDDRLPGYPVFETTPSVASAVIGRCYAFEYYLVAKDLSWLLCENHHNVLLAVGSLVEQRLLAQA